MHALTGPGPLAEDIRAIDWSQTALGPIEAWPERLRTVVELVLCSASAACLFWGQDGLMFFNEAWTATFASLSPALLGRPVAGLSHELHSCYLTRLKRMEAGEAGELFDALEPLGARDATASATCTPVVGETGVGQGVLVQIGPAATRLASPLRPGSEGACDEHRNTFMLRLIDSLSRLEDPMEIQTAAARMLGDYLGADRAGFAQIDIDKGTARLRTDFRKADGVPMRIDDYNLGEFHTDLARLRVGESLVEGGEPQSGKRFLDLAAKSQVSVPVHCSGRLMAALTLGQARPRVWSAEEISIAKEAARRAWDAVERSRADAAHRALKEALETEAVGVLFSTSDGRLTSSNDVFLRMSGFTRKEVESRKLHWSDIAPAEWLPITRNQHDRLAQTGHFGPYETEILRKNGSRAWAIFAGRKLGDGSVVQFIIDIDDRKRVEADLHHAEIRLRMAQEAAGVGTFDWIINANEGHWSAELLNILGLQPGEFGGTYEDWIATIHPEDLPRAVSAIETAFESGVLEGEWRVVRPDGTVLYVLARGLVEHDANDRPQRLTGAQVDITERVRNEQQVQFLLAELDARIEDLHREMRDRGI